MLRSEPVTAASLGGVVLVLAGAWLAGRPAAGRPAGDRPAVAAPEGAAAV